MKLAVIIMLVILLAGIISGLFLIEIPEGNREVAYMLLGMIGTTLIYAISDLFKKGVTHG
jgi:hypothetical protein